MIMPTLTSNPKALVNLTICRCRRTDKGQVPTPPGILVMAVEWKVAFPLHPEYRTLPMVWYIPPLSPIQSAADAGHIGMDGIIPDVKSLRIPVKYLANLLTAGEVTESAWLIKECMKPDAKFSAAVVIDPNV